MESLGTFKRTLLDYGSAIVGIAMLAWYVSPNRSSAKLIEAVGESFAVSVKAAQELQVVRETAADFHAKAMQAIADFWEGFTD